MSCPAVYFLKSQACWCTKKWKMTNRVCDLCEILLGDIRRFVKKEVAENGRHIPLKLDML